MSPVLTGKFFVFLAALAVSSKWQTVTLKVKNKRSFQNNVYKFELSLFKVKSATLIETIPLMFLLLSLKMTSSRFSVIFYCFLFNLKHKHLAPTDNIFVKFLYSVNFNCLQREEVNRNFVCAEEIKWHIKAEH